MHAEARSDGFARYGFLFVGVRVYLPDRFPGAELFFEPMGKLYAFLPHLATPRLRQPLRRALYTQALRMADLSK